MRVIDRACCILFTILLATFLMLLIFFLFQKTILDVFDYQIGGNHSIQ
jgi:predicted ABC-type sugar transport system permease subunit